MAHAPLPVLLAAAQEAAWLGGRSTLAWFNNGVEIETKSDATPVTIADRTAEERMRAFIEGRFPDHGIVGEEYGETRPSASVRWILDPIDGTKTFVQGVPLFGTLVGIEIDEEPCVGAIYMPALDEMVSASKGSGATWNGRPCRVADCGLDDAVLLTYSDWEARARSPAYEAVASRTRMRRTWGDCYAYVLLATGRAQVVLDPAMAVWDCAALLPVVEEAGGTFTDWKGHRTIRGGEALATTAALHSEVLALLQAADSSDGGA